MALRFCLFTTFYPPYHFGGDAVYVHRLAEALGAAGHQVDVIHSPDAYHLSHPGEPPIQYDELPNVTRHELRLRHRKINSLLVHQSGSPAFYTPQIRAVLEATRPDVIHYHNVSLLGAPGLFAMGDGIKLMTCHEYWLICATHVLFRYNREACTHRTCFRCSLRARRPPQLWRRGGVVERELSELDALIMSSHFAAQRHQEQRLASTFALIPPFVPIPDLQAVGPRPHQGNRPYFVYAGRLERLKGPQEALKIFHGLADIADLLLIGDGTIRSELANQAASMPHVRLLKAVRQDELSSYYMHASGVVVPSLCYETFGLSAAEAMAHGTPAVVRNHGALAEMIEQSGGGFAFTTDDEARNAIRRLATEPRLREDLRSRCRLHAECEWSRERHLERYFELVNRLVDLRLKGSLSPPGALLASTTGV